MSDNNQVSKGAGVKFDLRKVAGLSTRLPFPDADKPTKTHEVDVFSLPQSAVLGTPRYFALTIDGITLPNEPLITVSGSKTIVKTQVAGGDFTVKELIGRDDWKINIKGYAVREGANRSQGNGTLVPSEYPEEWMRNLIALYNKNTALDCECQLLSYFNINRLVIEDINFPPVAGAAGYFPYEINAMSDTSALGKLKLLRKP